MSRTPTVGVTCAKVTTWVRTVALSQVNACSWLLAEGQECVALLLVVALIVRQVTISKEKD